MTEVVPSWILKGGRAEKHLHDLKLLIAAWGDPHPYEVAIRSEGKKDVYRLHFTSTPGPDMTFVPAQTRRKMSAFARSSARFAYAASAIRSRFFLPIRHSPISRMRLSPRSRC